MARGFESKSVQDQQDAAESERRRDKTLLDAKEVASRREIAALRLQRAQILNSRTANPHRREALQRALTHVEAQLAALRVDDLD